MTKIFLFDEIILHRSKIIAKKKKSSNLSTKMIGIISMIYLISTAVITSHVLHPNCIVFKNNGKIEILICIGWLFVRFKMLGFHKHQWVKQDRVVTHPWIFCLYPCSISGLLWSFTFCLCFFLNAFQDSNLKRNTYTRAIVSVSQSLGMHSCSFLDHHRTYVSCTAFFSATHFVKKLKMAVCNIPFERQSLFSVHTWTQPD